MNQQKEQLPDHVIISWLNKFLVRRYMKINDLSELMDGIVFASLLEITCAKRVPVNKNPKFRIQKLENWKICLEFLKNNCGLKLESISAADLVDGNYKLTRGLLWSYILRIPISCEEPLSLPHSYDSLLEWVRCIVIDYDITNFSSDWANGKALCALVNQLSPNLMNLPLNFTNMPLLDAQMGIDNAKNHLNIPDIITAEDMVYQNTEKIASYICYFREYELVTISRNKIERESYRSSQLVLLLQHLPSTPLPKEISYYIGIMAHTFYEPYISPLSFRDNIK